MAEELCVFSRGARGVADDERESVSLEERGGYNEYRWPVSSECAVSSDMSSFCEKRRATPRLRVVPVRDDPQWTWPLGQSFAQLASSSGAANVSARATTSKFARVRLRNNPARSSGLPMLRTFWKMHRISRRRRAPSSVARPCGTNVGLAGGPAPPDRRLGPVPGLIQYHRTPVAGVSRHESGARRHARSARRRVPRLAGCTRFGDERAGIHS